MATVVLMPAVVADAEDAVLTAWLVAEGETVTKGQALAEIETDKANVEVEAQAEGTVGRLVGAPGDRIAVGAPIAVLLGAGEDASAMAEALGEQAPAAATAPVAAAPPNSSAVEASSSAPAAPTTIRKPGERIFASPLARRIAAEHDLDIALIPGRGPRGRVVRADVEAAIAAAASAPATASAAPLAAAPQPSSAAQAGVEKPRRAETFPSEPAPEAGGAYEDIPLTGMRRAIARRLSASKSTVPHWYLSVDAQLDALLDYRRQLNEFGRIKISVNDLLIKAIASALQAVPEANAVWNGDSIRRYSTVDISVAVSTPVGLVTPVVRGVEKLGMSALARTTKDLIERGRDGKLKQHEIEGGSFSISNLGMYGVRDFCAIINPPQSAILAVGAGEQRPVITAGGELGIATVMTMTLSSDHRVIDGSLAAEFMQVLKARLENPALLAL